MRGIWKRRASVAVLAWLVLGGAAASQAFTFMDPTFHEKGSWSSAMLGIPPPGYLGAIQFSADGNTLYVVGNSDTPASAVYAVPVTRDAVTGEVTDLGAASSTPFFSANVSTPAGGLDTGLEAGPGGTFFYTYFNANGGNFIGERAPSALGTEMQFNLAPLGVPLWLSGLTFSPFRMDPGTGFGNLQVSVYNGDPDTTPRDIYEIALTPIGNGFFTPGAKTLFLTLAAGDVLGFQYVPSGTLAGGILYASFDAGEVRYITIDPGTGLPIDKTTGVPTLGTTAPMDQLFAVEPAVDPNPPSPGPAGLAFDPVTNDLFISTFQGDPYNAVTQVGGFPVGGSTTTTVPSSSSTTTTLPSAGCPAGATFPSIDCRLDALIADVMALGDVGTITGKLESKAVKTKSRADAADALGTQGRRRGAKAALTKAIRLIRGFRTLLGSRGARRIPDATRTMLSADAMAIQGDLRTLKTGL
jgi:hypothetical protein